VVSKTLRESVKQFVDVIMADLKEMDEVIRVQFTELPKLIEEIVFLSLAFVLIFIPIFIFLFIFVSSLVSGFQVPRSYESNIFDSKGTHSTFITNFNPKIETIHHGRTTLPLESRALPKD